MIKGLNRQIIEVSETGNFYFEKVLLFVRPQMGNLEDHYLKKEATKLVKKLGQPPKLGPLQKRRRKRKWGIRTAFALFWCLMGALTFALAERVIF